MQIKRHGVCLLKCLCPRNYAMDEGLWRVASEEYNVFIRCKQI